MFHLARKTYRSWWQKPLKVVDRPDEREVSFLELFYDLAYVVIVIQMTYVIIDAPSLTSVLHYIALFTMVWWAWFNGSMYHELHGNNDIRTRVFTFLQMFALVGMGIFINGAFTDAYQGFALSYGAFLAIVAFLWGRVNYHDPEHRRGGVPYTIAFSATALAFLASAFIEPPFTHYIWAAGIGISLLLPTLLARNPVTPAEERQIEAAQRITPSTVERFGLLTIIVLGESVISIVRGASYIKHGDITSIATIFLTLAIVIALWWVYFDFIARRLPIQKQRQRFSWIYIHVPLLMSLGLTSAGILNIIKHIHHFDDFSRWLLIGPVVLFLLCISLLIQTLAVKASHVAAYQKATRVIILAALLMLCVGLAQLPLLVTLGATVIILLSPVYSAFYMFVQHLTKRTTTDIS